MRDTRWEEHSNYPADYDARAQKLANRFAENFKQYADQATPDILAAGPSA